MKDKNKALYLLLFVLALIVNLSGINVKLFTDDQGLYASIAKNLIYKKDIFQLFTYNLDWLDKPHFPFWATMVSFKLFGISAWAYRLPALICFLLSLLYTWLLARKYYNWETAFTAVLILMTAQHVLLSNTDVRAEPYLMGMLTGAVYHISQLQDRYSLKDFVLAALLTAFAVMTKGVFVVIPIYGALWGQLIFQKIFKEFFRWKWAALIGLTILFTLPEFYALYIQFDLHPEKTVFGLHHVSGIKWFLWDSQFGRFVNSGPINRKASSGSIFFYLHTLLWAFAPWCLLFYYTVFENLRNLFSGRKLNEYYSLWGGLLMLALFSLSGFQLPFYTNIVIPLFAITVAPFCVEQFSRFGKGFFQAVQWLYTVALIVVIIVANYLLKPENDIFFWVDFILFFVAIVLIIVWIKNRLKSVFFMSCAAALFAGFFLNTVFYNEVIPYKGEITAADFINQEKYKNTPVYSLKAENNIFQFYCNKPVDFLPIEDFGHLNPKDSAVFYASQSSMDYLKQNNRGKFRILKSFIDYPKETIKPAFINRKTRQATLDSVYLVVKQ